MATKERSPAQKAALEKARAALLAKRIATAKSPQGTMFTAQHAPAMADKLIRSVLGGSAPKRITKTNRPLLLAQVFTKDPAAAKKHGGKMFRVEHAPIIADEIIRYQLGKGAPAKILPKARHLLLTRALTGPVAVPVAATGATPEVPVFVPPPKAAAKPKKAPALSASAAPAASVKTSLTDEELRDLLAEYLEQKAVPPAVAEAIASAATDSEGAALNELLAAFENVPVATRAEDQASQLAEQLEAAPRTLPGGAQPLVSPPLRAPVAAFVAPVAAAPGAPVVHFLDMLDVIVTTAARSVVTATKHIKKKAPPVTANALIRAMKKVQLLKTTTMPGSAPPHIPMEGNTHFNADRTKGLLRQIQTMIATNDPANIADDIQAALAPLQ